jgi:chaperone modulatory protein CbpM
MAEQRSTPVLDSVIVEEEVSFSLVELCRTCDAEPMLLIELVQEGVLEPQGSTPEDWQFSGHALRRARSALRLSRDLELGIAGVALALDLLDEIDMLRSRLRRTRSP